MRRGIYHQLYLPAKKYWTGLFIFIGLLAGAPGNIYGQSDTIQGLVSWGGDPIDQAKILLYKYDAAKARYLNNDTFNLGTGSNGQYIFTQLNAGQYIIRAVPDSLSWTFEWVVPTYHKSAVIWEKASPVSLSGDGQSYTADINLVEVRKDTGRGEIRGKVVQAGPGKRKGPGDPEGGVEILAMDQSGNPKDFTYTDNDGIFVFSNLALDTYEVRVEIAGFNIQNTTVVLDSNQKSSDSLNFGIDKKEGSVISSIPDQGSYGKFGRDFVIYPNPAGEALEIRLKARYDQTLTINLWDLSGKKAIQKVTTVEPGNNKIPVGVSNLEEGIYLLKIKSGKETVKYKIQKVVISR